MYRRRTYTVYYNNLRVDRFFFVSIIELVYTIFERFTARSIYERIYPKFTLSHEKDGLAETADEFFPYTLANGVRGGATG